jgi:hypothetical protein
MEKDVEVTQTQIQLIHVGWKPNLLKMAKRKDHAIWSKAISISILTTISPPRPFFDLIEWSNSWAKIELSWIFLEGTKANWYVEIKRWSKPLKWLARPFNIIL